ncbi:DNA polymerase III subunit alpha [Saprospiraceae bacterium]|nr:DNA polymerase III subunit alpha [Saprospiraceae bacterium]
MPKFAHLHCHTQYSLLDGASEIGVMMDKAMADGQTAVALTDHGNMFGAYKFVAEANKRDILPIVGCEFYMVEDRHKRKFEKAKGQRDIRYHQLMLAKNAKGYQNLCKLCSLGYIDGQYGKFPRIDKELIEQYHEGIIATSCCLGAEVPQAIMHGLLEEAEEKLKWWLNLFGEDYYVELQRHSGLEKLDYRDRNGNKAISKYSQEDINQILIGFAKKHNIKIIATNDVHYVEEEDNQPHDLLLCVNTGSFVEDQNRFKFASSDFYFKTQDEMNYIFGDVPQAIDNTMEIASKIDKLTLSRDVLLPAFPLPKGFDSQESFLRHITYVGANRKYDTITPIISERLDFELSVINASGYPGYFLIVQDFTTVARELGVSVGPGRGSAAGSAVAYCLGITNIDPIKYDLLFERFLNPERISLPDIDIDFDDEGRSKVIDYVIEKYGRNQVAQIITYGTMAAKSSIKDVGRVMQVPLNEVNDVTKSFPEQLGASLKDVLAVGGVAKKLKDKLNGDDVEKAAKFRVLSEQENKIGEMIQMAKKLEGSVRNTGIHACGVIITPDDITNYVPVTVAKDSDMLVSQFDNSVAEDAGLLKMDFLGLKTLTIIKDAVINVKDSKGIDLISDEFPLEDKLTYELFQRGETVGIFQYESSGMQKHLKDLKPTAFEDLIAMNALYRPGPMQYIPDFVARKHGVQEIKYDLSDMEEYLSETYGITVYQEQVMLLSQKLANFTKGEADMLRKAMGKKKKKLIDEMFPKFMEGCEKNGHDKEICKKVWSDWEAFASYAFNKSHSTCYAFIAFQTAYLKAHYPSEYMASVLNHNKTDISKINFFLRECKRMGITVLGPDINESVMKFNVNEKDEIRFGLSALKGVGEGPVNEIIRARKEDGNFENLFDMAHKLNFKAVNKRCLESLVLGGALDSFTEVTREQYFGATRKFSTLLEELVRYGNAYQTMKESNAVSLFGETDEALIDQPQIPEVLPWTNIDKLDKEKEVTGIYISGHPLDDFKLEFKYFVQHTLEQAEMSKDFLVKVAGIVTSAQHGVSQRGTAYGRFTLQDYRSELELALYNEQYEEWKSLLFKGNIIYLEGANKKGWGDRYMFKVSKIKMLDTVGKQMTKSITIKVPLDRINEQFIEHLDGLCEENEGSHKLKMRILDMEHQISIDVKSGNKMINASFEFVTALEEMGIQFKLN